MGLLRRLWAAVLNEESSRVVGLRRMVVAIAEHARHVAMMARCVDELRRSCDPDYETQKAELDAMRTRQTRQEELFALLKNELLEDGFDVAEITLVSPDAEAAEHAADSAIAAFEIEDELNGSSTAPAPLFRDLTGLH